MSHRRLALRLLLALSWGIAASLSTPASAQTVGEADGSWVRVRVADPPGSSRTRTITGRLVDADETSLTIHENGSRPAVAISRAEVVALEVRLQQGRKTQGALIGFGVGGLLGALIGYSGGDDPPGMMSMEAEGKALAGGIVFGLLGALIGTLSAPGEQWDFVATDDIDWRVTQSASGENRIGLAWRF